MGGLYIGLGNFEITLNHAQGGMAEDALQGVDISSIAEKVD